RWCLRGNVAGRADPVPITRRILPSEIRETVVLADAEHLQVWIVPRCEQAEGTDRLRRGQKRKQKIHPAPPLLGGPPEGVGEGGAPPRAAPPRKVGVPTP